MIFVLTFTVWDELVSIECHLMHQIPCSCRRPLKIPEKPNILGPSAEGPGGGKGKEWMGYAVGRKQRRIKDKAQTHSTKPQLKRLSKAPTDKTKTATYSTKPQVKRAEQSP